MPEANERLPPLPGFSRRAGGFLRTGQYIDAGDLGHHELHTITSAAGIEGDDGGHVRSFGDSSLDGGVIPAMIA